MSRIKKFWALYNTVWWWEWEKCLYPSRLDTYGQWCSHNCSYCYARALLDFRWLWHPNNPKFIDLKEAYRIIATEIPKWQITRLWWMTDCFQPVEKVHKITYNVLKAFKACKKPYLIVTKSDLIATDEYIEVLDRDLAHIQVTITSTNDELAATYEHATRPSDSDKIIVEFLRVNHRIQQRFKIDYSDYTHSEWWYLHLPLDKKIQLISKIKKPQISVCEDVDLHYKYRKENFNFNPDDCCNLRK